MKIHRLIPRNRLADTDRRGAAAVEFGLVLPLLILIAIGAVDLGRFATNYIAVSNAASVGASFGAMHPKTAASSANWETYLKQHVLAEMETNLTQDSSVSQSDVSVAPAVVNEANGYRRVDVTVSMPFRPIIQWPGVPEDWTLTRKVSMRVIR